MPLLKRKVFEKAKVPEFLRDDEEVFHCEVTNEIFRDYEEFCERMILVNSMVWTCSMTGRSNLTYAEALESEENARKNLRDFPAQLRVPILYLAARTKRATFTEMSDDIWTFVRDRYFVGEIIEACLNDGSWYEAQILQVMAPTQDILEKHKSDPNSTDLYSPPASLFRYEVEQTTDDNQIFIVDASKIRRKKSQYTHDRSRLFLKQFAELSPEGYWRVKGPMYQKYNINKITFDQIFDGPIPDFSKVKKTNKKQETLTKYFSKTNNSVQKKKTEPKSNKKDLVEEIKRRSEEIKEKVLQDKLRKKEELRMKRQLERAANSRKNALLKEWHRQQEDLELEDHKRLPVPTPVETKIPSTYFGDALMVLDFVNTFADILSTKKYFYHGLSVELLERCLTQSEINGPLTDLLKLLLNAIFLMQIDEATEIKNVRNPQDTIVDEKDYDNVTFAKAIRLATSAAALCPGQQGLPLSRMPLDGLTVTEVLRIHLLSSGSKKTENTARWQFQQRGGYTCEDDPGLQFRIDYPHILRELRIKHVCELSMGDKLKILSCLTNQISTYADVRDIIEERLEKARQAKQNLKLLQTAERKFENEIASLRTKTKREWKAKLEGITDQEKDEINHQYEMAMNKIQQEHDKKQAEFSSKTKELNSLTNISNTRLSYLGTDRAYRRYIFIHSLPALFVEHDEENPGPCLEKLVTPNPDLIDIPDEDKLKYIYQYAENKENSQNTLQKKNGINKQFADTKLLKDLWMCTGNPSDCPVHSNSVDKIKWSFYHKPEDIEQLIDSLNKRGVREGDLRLILENSRDYLLDEIQYCPSEKLSLKLAAEQQPDNRLGRGKIKYLNANFGFDPNTSVNEIMEITLRDYILDLEQQVWSGGLGALHVAERTSWRTCLKERNYDLTVLKSNKDSKNKGDADDNKSNESRESSPGPEVPGSIMNGISDTATLLSNIKMDIEDDLDPLAKDPLADIDTDSTNKAIVGLATALEALAYSVHEKYLNRPLGHAGGSRDKKDIHRKDYLDRWDDSLMKCTSFSQLLFHYSTLETSIDLSKSALNARCFMCRKCTDDDQLLLCDGCNRGQHLYCIEPKLTSVPTGDWFCDRCKPAETPRMQRRSRKRRIFSEASDDEQNINEHTKVNGYSNSKYSNSDASDNENEIQSDAQIENETVTEVCEICQEGGRVVCCDSCPKMYHPECLDPPLKRIPRGTWNCADCKKREADEGAKKVRAQRLEKRNLERDSSSDAEDSDNQPLMKASSRRSRRTQELSDDLPLHNAPLQELLSEVLKHPDAWPFTQPVLKRDVPDYFDVITHPMDFGTIKYKLNMGKYQYDAELMADAMLVFENCNTYNDSEAVVYKCGVKLLRFFKQKAHELGLHVPNIMTGMDEDLDVSEDDTHSDSSNNINNSQSTRNQDSSNSRLRKKARTSTN